MGRKRTRSSDSISNGGAVDSDAEKEIEKRLFGKQICRRCNARNPKNADKCRKCGHTELRPKRSEYRNA